MVQHLKKKVETIREIVQLSSGDLVVDIGSNDGTTLGFYPEDLTLVGVDPTAGKFRDYYKRHISVVPDFLNSPRVVRSWSRLFSTLSRNASYVARSPIAD